MEWLIIWLKFVGRLGWLAGKLVVVVLTPLATFCGAVFAEVADGVPAGVFAPTMPIVVDALTEMFERPVLMGRFPLRPAGEAAARDDLVVLRWLLLA